VQERKDLDVNNKVVEFFDINTILNTKDIISKNIHAALKCPCCQKNTTSELTSEMEWIHNFKCESNLCPSKPDWFVCLLCINWNHCQYQYPNLKSLVRHSQTKHHLQFFQKFKNDDNSDTEKSPNYKKTKKDISFGNNLEFAKKK